MGPRKRMGCRFQVSLCAHIHQIHRFLNDSAINMYRKTKAKCNLIIRKFTHTFDIDEAGELVVFFI